MKFRIHRICNYNPFQSFSFVLYINTSRLIVLSFDFSVDIFLSILFNINIHSPFDKQSITHMHIFNKQMLNSYYSQPAPTNTERNYISKIFMSQLSNKNQTTFEIFLEVPQRGNLDHKCKVLAILTIVLLRINKTIMIIR